MSARRSFRDRRDAGRKLAARLRSYRDLSPIVLGLPRGGVPVAFEVAQELDAPLDVCVVRKIGAPEQPELGVGAVGEEAVLYVDRDAMAFVGVSEAELEHKIDVERAEVEARVRRYRPEAAPISVRDKVVLLIDDGVATGGTARAAIQTLAVRGAGRVVLAVPVGATQTLDELACLADEIVCLHPREDFFAVSESYDDFTQTSDDEVVQLLGEARSRLHPNAAQRRRSERVRTTFVRNVQIPAGDQLLEGKLTIPPSARGLVAFTHGSGSGRHSRLNQYVASELRAVGLATLLFDLFTPEEDVIDAFTAHRRFDIDRLASRLAGATDWAREQSETRGLALGFFGGGKSAAAALVVAAERPGVVHAVVSLGGRPDLADAWLGRVNAPTLLVVGGADPDALAVNREAFDHLKCEKRLEVIPRATHRFVEEGALEDVARLAATWFTEHLDADRHKVTA